MYEEVAEYLNITEPEAQQMFRDIYPKVPQEWERRRSTNSFYRNTPYYLFDLMNWEKGGKKEFTKEILSYCKSRDVKVALDYGCGIGTDAIAMAEAGVKVYLADIPSKHFYFALWRMYKRGLPVEGIISITEDCPPLPNTDLVVCIAVLEHLENPEPNLINMIYSTKALAI